MPNPAEIVRSCHSLLKNTGILFLYVPHGKSLSMRLLKGNSISSWIPFHLQLFTKKSLTLLLQRANFSQVKTYQYSPPSWLPLSFMQAWNRIKGSSELKHAFPKWLFFFCLPIGWIGSKIGLGEELVAVGCKRQGKG
jgi:hypothetical protein